jgi:hypothetical protein
MGMGFEGSHIVMKTSCSSFFFNSQVNNAQVRKFEKFIHLFQFPSICLKCLENL